MTSHEELFQLVEPLSVDRQDTDACIARSFAQHGPSQTFNARMIEQLELTSAN